MLRTLLFVLTLGAPVIGQSGAKAMFYDPADAGFSAVKASLVDVPRLKPVSYAEPFPPLGHVGLHYWFEDGQGTILTDTQAVATTQPITLHMRNNVGHGFLTIWSITDGAERTPRAGRWAGHAMTTETFTVPGSFRLTPGGPAIHLIAVFARSQTEMAGSADHARQRLRNLGARVGRDRLPEIIRESDDTPGEVGTYVVNREGMPVATEIILRAR